MKPWPWRECFAHGNPGLRTVNEMYGQMDEQVQRCKVLGLLRYSMHGALSSRDSQASVML